MVSNVIDESNAIKQITEHVHFFLIFIDTDSIPKLYYYVSAPNKNDILVTELLGENLRSLFKKYLKHYENWSSISKFKFVIYNLDMIRS